MKDPNVWAKLPKIQPQRLTGLMRESEVAKVVAVEQRMRLMWNKEVWNVCWYSYIYIHTYIYILLPSQSPGLNFVSIHTGSFADSNSTEAKVYHGSTTTKTTVWSIWSGSFCDVANRVPPKKSTQHGNPKVSHCWPWIIYFPDHGSESGPGWFQSYPVSSRTQCCSVFCHPPPQLCSGFLLIYSMCTCIYIYIQYCYNVILV